MADCRLWMIFAGGVFVHECEAQRVWLNLKASISWGQGLRCMCVIQVCMRMHVVPDCLPTSRREEFSGEGLHPTPTASPRPLWGQGPLGGTFLLTTGWAEPQCNLLGCWGDPRPVVSGSLCPSLSSSAL